MAHSRVVSVRRNRRADLLAPPRAPFNSEVCEVAADIIEKGGEAGKVKVEATAEGKAKAEAKKSG